MVWYSWSLKASVGNQKVSFGASSSGVTPVGTRLIVIWNHWADCVFESHDIIVSYIGIISCFVGRPSHSNNQAQTGKVRYVLFRWLQLVRAKYARSHRVKPVRFRPSEDSSLCGTVICLNVVSAHVDEIRGGMDETNPPIDRML